LLPQGAHDLTSITQKDRKMVAKTELKASTFIEIHAGMLLDRVPFALDQDTYKQLKFAGLDKKEVQAALELLATQGHITLDHTPCGVVVDHAATDAA
jgi:hypothetical protein